MPVTWMRRPGHPAKTTRGPCRACDRRHAGQGTGPHPRKELVARNASRSLRLLAHPYAIAVLVLLRQRSQEYVVDLIPLVTQQLLPRLVEVLRDVIRAGLLLVGHDQHHARLFGVNGRRDLSLGQREGYRCRTTHGANVRNLAVLADEVAGLDRHLHLRRGLLQVIQYLGPVVQLVGLLLEQRRSLLAAIVIQNMRLVLGELRSMRRLDIDHCKHGVAVAYPNTLTMRV